MDVDGPCHWHPLLYDQRLGSLPLDLLRSCQQIHQEATSILYSRTAITIDIRLGRGFPGRISSFRKAAQTINLLPFHPVYHQYVKDVTFHLLPDQDTGPLMFIHLMLARLRDVQGAFVGFFNTDDPAFNRHRYSQLRNEVKQYCAGWQHPNKGQQETGRSVTTIRPIDTARQAHIMYSREDDRWRFVDLPDMGIDDAVVVEERIRDAQTLAEKDANTVVSSLHSSRLISSCESLITRMFGTKIYSQASPAVRPDVVRKTCLRCHGCVADHGHDSDLAGPVHDGGPWYSGHPSSKSTYLAHISMAESNRREPQKSCSLLSKALAWMKRAMGWHERPGCTRVTR